MYKLLLFITLILFIPTQIIAQVNPYQSRANNYSYLKPSKTNLDLEYMVLCKKQLEYDISVAKQYVEICTDYPSLCNLSAADLSHSSWIDKVGSLYYDGGGCSVIFLKNGNAYYFKYIPPNILSVWEKSSSPGLFYHRYIKDSYSLSQCIDYSPDYR